MSSNRILRFYTILPPNSFASKTNSIKDKQSPTPVASIPQLVVQVPSSLQQKIKLLDNKPPRADGSDKYYGMENVYPPSSILVTGI